MSNFKLNKLPQELVNQIAAGEVVERPASVVKELVDNSIDASADLIEIKVVNGGIDLIEVSDNGLGIPKQSLSDIFMSHTTSKISTLEDLNTLMTMGFRGEALSSILSVSKVSVVSRYIDDDTGAKIEFKSFNDFSIKKAARETGTQVSVKDIFNNVPARKKFLKTAQTEYKKIVDILYPYFLIHPEIHFKLVKDRKVVFDLKQIQDAKPNTIVKERVEDLLKEEFVKKMAKVFYNGAGMRIEGLVAHPSDHQKRSNNQYIFVNGRPVWDNGIARAVIQGYERYIPFGQRVPFLLSLNINPDLVDVNVHPRKEEVRFLNPFRVYSGVEEAVKKALSSITSYKVDSEYTQEGNTKSLSFVNKDMDKRIYSSKDITFEKNQSGSVRDSLLFSKEVLTEGGYTKVEHTPLNGVEGIRNIFQIFNKYIVIEFENEILWMIDQHAAAERITFEKLKNSESLNMEKQNLLVSNIVKFSTKELDVLEDLKDFFSQLGIDYVVKDDAINISSVPVEFLDADFNILFDEIFQLSDDVSDMSNMVNKLRDDILATMSCHTSVRSGQSLYREEMMDIYRKLIVCENPYSCPHGRPVVWKLKLSEIDSNFERTY